MSIQQLKMASSTFRSNLETVLQRRSMTIGSLAASVGMNSRILILMIDEGAVSLSLMDRISDIVDVPLPDMMRPDGTGEEYESPF